MSTLTSILIDPANDDRSQNDAHTQFIVCGDYLCWKDPEKPTIHITNVQDLKKQIKYNFAKIFFREIKVVPLDLPDLLKKEMMNSSS